MFDNYGDIYSNSNTTNLYGNYKKPTIGIVNKDNDESRGFRLFDGALFSIKDISSEELFLNRVKIAYSAFNKYVEPSLLKSPEKITKVMLNALAATIVRYFSKQAYGSANKPVITKIVYLNSPQMFCNTSDFCRSYMYVKSNENDSLIDDAIKVFGSEQIPDFNNRDGNSGGDNFQSNYEIPSPVDIPAEWVECAKQWSRSEEIMKSLAGEIDMAVEPDNIVDSFSNFNVDAKNDSEALLFLLCDYETLHNYIAYIMYMTPFDTGRRYYVEFDCLKRHKHDLASGEVSNGATACCAKQAENNVTDMTKNAISSFIMKRSSERKSRLVEELKENEKNDTLKIRSAVSRNSELLKNVLLMLFDKNVSRLLDNGFDNLNKRRKYSTYSKEIGSSTIYTGIIDTVGNISTKLKDSPFIIGGVDDVTDNNNLDVGDSRRSNDTLKEIRIVLPLPLN